jgi:hypothetical protein
VVFLIPGSVVAGPDAAHHEGLLQGITYGEDTRTGFTQRWVKGPDGSWRITRWEVEQTVSVPKQTD